MAAHPKHDSKTHPTLPLLTLAACFVAACASQGEEASGSETGGSTTGSSPTNVGAGAPVGTAPSGIAGSGADAPTGAPSSPAPPTAGGTSNPTGPVSGGIPDVVDDLMAPTGETLTPARCAGDATKTIVIGDSYIALSGDIPRFLQQYSGQTYRLHAVSGTAMVGGLPPSIPDQYRLALAQGAVETIVMDGGGNDVLLGDITCHTTGPAGPMEGSGCAQTIQRAVQGARDLLNEAAANGVREVVYFLYPHLIGLNADLNPSLDYAIPLFEQACAEVDLDCKLVDTRAAFEGHPEYLGIDGIHPTAFGSEVIAQMVWDVMGFNCENGVAVK